MSSVFHFNLSKNVSVCRYLSVQISQKYLSVEQILECEVGQVVNQCWLEFFSSTAVRVGLSMCYTETGLAWKAF